MSLLKYVVMECNPKVKLETLVRMTEMSGTIQDKSQLYNSLAKRCGSVSKITELVILRLYELVLKWEK